MWFQIEGNEFWLLIWDISDTQIVISGFKENPPLCFIPSFIPSLSSLHVLGSILSQSYPYLNLFLGPVLDLLHSNSIEQQICFSFSVKCDITVFSILTFSPQVPTKKAKLKESRLQIMEDEEDPLDKYLVRNCLHSSPRFAFYDDRPHFLELLSLTF